MNVVHVIESGGGSALFVHYLAKYQPNNFHYIIAGKRAMEYFEKLETENNLQKNIRLIEWKVSREINFIEDFKSLFFLNKILKRLHYDLIHCHSSKAGFLSRFLFLFQPRKKIIYCPHGAPFLRKDVSFLKRYLYITFEYIAALICGKVIACSMSESLEYKKIGIEADFINNGTEILSNESKMFSNINNKKDFVIATIGRITYQKNPKLFNEIASRFIGNDNVKFLWIGSGELENELISSNIEVSGWKSPNEILQLLSYVDIYISTSLWEGLPLSVLEAMNSSKPLLLYPCVGNVDVLKVGYNGFSFTDSSVAFEYINFLKENTYERLNMGGNSRKLVEVDFNIYTQIALYEAFYISYIGKK